MAGADYISVFADNCAFIRSVALHSQMLFEDSTIADRGRMSRAAGIFFGDLNSALNDFIILQVCKITDPARDRKSENFTLLFLLEHYGFKIEPPIAELIDRIESIRQKLLPARNKRIAHADRAAAFDPRPLGAVPREEWQQFWRDLDEIVNIMHEKATGEPFHLNEIGIATDADGLLKALKAGECFEKLLHGGDSDLTHKCADLFFATE